MSEVLIFLNEDSLSYDSFRIYAKKNDVIFKSKYKRFTKFKYHPVYYLSALKNYKL